ncbi:MAG: hypothetical protein ACK41E_02275 [Deinococcales bacterium]
MSWFDAWQQLNDTVLLEACSLWGICDLQHVSSNANAVYRAKRGTELVFLRLCHQTQRTESFLAAGIDWARQLRAHGAQVCVPLQSVQGNLIERICDEWLSVLWQVLTVSRLTTTTAPNNSRRGGKPWGVCMWQAQAMRPKPC